jgi:hypothetical protein
MWVVPAGIEPIGIWACKSPGWFLEPRYFNRPDPDTNPGAEALGAPGTPWAICRFRLRQLHDQRGKADDDGHDAGENDGSTSYNQIALRDAPISPGSVHTNPIAHGWSG